MTDDCRPKEAAPWIIIRLSERGWGDCAMCNTYRKLNHAVAWYCGPTHDEIGAISTEYGPCDGRPAIVGGMCVCKECHDLHYAPELETEIKRSAAAKTETKP